ncbi:MAG: hypothetical protein JOZ78_11450 [Chroococcidiopsidaceae cyanobacterium CP_BM_ER_R8_30]|nr:hypothetical protein [Chroococcidiopsidaceae cyanobacterium CP_BM_ER_R8_30]
MLLSQKRSDDIVRDQYFSQTAVSNSSSRDSFVPVEGNAQAKTAHCATITGSMLGAIGGCLAGMGVLAIPGFVPILAIGSAGTAVVITLAGAGIGLAGGGLISTLAATDESEKLN